VERGESGGGRHDGLARSPEGSRRDSVGCVIHGSGGSRYSRLVMVMDADELCFAVTSSTRAKPVCCYTLTARVQPSSHELQTDPTAFADISKDDLRTKLAETYKAEKDAVSVFGLRTHFGGGKSTGFALIYDSVDMLKKFEPHYRLVRYGQASKIEKPSRQQRTLFYPLQRRMMLMCVFTIGKQRKNKQKALRGTAKVKGAKKKKET